MQGPVPVSQEGERESPCWEGRNGKRERKVACERSGNGELDEEEIHLKPQLAHRCEVKTS